MFTIKEVADRYLNGPQMKISNMEQQQRRFEEITLAQCLPIFNILKVYYRSDYNPTYEMVCNEIDKYHAITINTSNNDGWAGPATSLNYRLWHDWLHYRLGADFSWDGESRVCLAHMMCFNSEPVLQRIMFSEILGQAAVYFETGDFAPGQHLMDVPDGWMFQLMNQN